jgi:hypothetical protein
MIWRLSTKTFKIEAEIGGSMVIFPCSSVRKINTPAKKGMRFTLAAGMTTSFPSTASGVATHRKKRLSEV